MPYVVRVVHVLDGDIQAVEAGQQGQSLPVDRLAVQGLLQQFGRLSTSTVSSKVCTVLWVRVVTLPRMFTTPLDTPSLVTKVMSRFLICRVIGTRSVFSVTLMKSVRTSKGKTGPLISLCSEMKFSRSVNLIGGGANILAASSMRSNSLACCEADSGPAPRCSMPRGP